MSGLVSRFLKDRAIAASDLAVFIVAAALALASAVAAVALGIAER